MIVTKASYDRVHTRRSLNDPCVICGGTFGECHDVLMTAPYIKRVKKMTVEEELQLEMKGQINLAD